MKPRLTSLVLAGLVVWLAGGQSFAASAPTDRRPSPSGQTREAMHLLKTQCLSCHNQEKKKGGLVLLTRERMLEGGDDGAVVVPGKPESSLLVKVLLKESDPHMPPKKQLAEAQIKLVRSWVKAGANWDAAALDEEEIGPPVTLASLPYGYQPVLALAISPDGRRLAVGRGGHVVIHDVTATNFPIRAEFDAHRDAVQALAWSPDGRWLASGGFRRLALWDGESFALSRELTNGLSGRITAMQFADHDTLALADGVAAQSGFVRRVDAPTGKLLDSWRAHDDTIFALDFSRDGKQLVTAGGDKLIKVWDRGSKKELARLEGHTAQVLGVAFNTNATQVLSGGADKQLKVWDIKTREKIVTLGNPSSAVVATAWTGDGSLVVAATEAGTVVTYKNLKAHTGEQSSASADERKLGDMPDTVDCLAVTPDAKTIFAGSYDGVVQVWNREGKLLAQLQATRPRESDLQEKMLANKPNEGVNAPSPGKWSGGRIVSLSADPPEIQLSPVAPSHGVLITARTAEGFDIDATAWAAFSAAHSAPFAIAASGELRATRPGDGLLTASFRGTQIKVPVKVRGDLTNGSAAALAPSPVSFVRDVLPALSKAGCNAGACHAKAEGQNGFKLSVFSYDPKSDYAEIVKEDRGRRVFPAAPDESLIIKKPTTALPHEGGLRYERGSETYQLLVRWLREGMPYSLTNEPVLERISVFPKERRYRKGATQRLLVQAHYSDGGVRDVTRLAAFAENDKEIAKVDDRGVMTIGALTGQGVVLARYMGFVADAQILVPAERLLPEAQYAALPTNNFIDGLAYAHFQQLGLFPSELCTDAEFLRRAYLDAIGRLPRPEEVREFLDGCEGPRTVGHGSLEHGNQGSTEHGSLKDEVSARLAELPARSNVPTLQRVNRQNPRPTENRSSRTALINRLLDDPAYADYWANKWADLLRPNPDRVGVKSVFVLDQWLRESFRQNKPYDQFVREILLAEGSNHRDGPAVIYRDRREPADLTTMFSLLFLGTRLECARCHHHPNEKWSQDDFYQFAAFFGTVKQKGAGLSPPISGGAETFYFAPGASVKHPVSGAVMSPRPPDGPPAHVAERADPRRALADRLTAPENPFFARAAVNRVWAVFFGRGLVEPVDDFRISNPCANPALLSALAEDFTRHGYDLKHLIRTILRSRLYQLSSTPNESNLADTHNFSRAYRRRLPAEVLLDAVNEVTGVPDTFAAMPIGSRATQAWSYKIESQFMDAFSRPNPSSDPPCERDRQLSVVQSLHLANSKALQAKLANKSGRARQLAGSKKSPDEIVNDLYLATLSRPPTDEELKRATAAFTAPGATRPSATEDVFWALLNSPEFVFNH